MGRSLAVLGALTVFILVVCAAVTFAAWFLGVGR